LPEIQSLDIEKVVKQKAGEAWSLLQRPLLVDDGGAYLEQYPQFPGALTKYVYEGIGLEGIWKLAKDNSRAWLMNYLLYCDGPQSFHLFKGICYGKLIEPTTIIDPRLPYTSIFIPDGSDTLLAHLRGTQEEKAIHHRWKAARQFIMWYKTTKQMRKF
jgi:XTP/dITP diphosphohydrolase